MPEVYTRERPMAVSIAILRYKGALCILPIVQIVLGAQWLDDCPIKPQIPVYLVVMGIYCLMMIGLSYLPYCFDKKSWLWILAIVCGIIFFMIFIAGNVWIYSIYEPNYRSSRGPYCKMTLYQFAFWATNVTYIQLALLTCCCVCCHTVCKDDEESQQVIPEQPQTENA